MKLPVVAIVGRPNVGKSSLFNRFAGHRISIVDPTPGVTRDRVSTIITHRDVTMEIIDTGGVGIVDRDDLGDHVERQIQRAVAEANLIIFLTDVKDGITSLDREVARRLRERAREIPVLLVVNKVDTTDLEDDAGEFFALGIGDPMPVSALHSRGTLDVLDRVVEKLWPTGDVATDPVMKLAVVGRQNVGKSTFVNAIAREDRMIVSEVPGTTRDAVDVHFEKDARQFMVIDTAGVRQISRARNQVEIFSQLRTENAIRRADVVLLILDASRDMTRADKRLGDFIAQEGRVCIIVANKWDLTEGKIATSQYAEYLAETMPVLSYAPIVFTTASQARNIQSVIDLAQHLFKTSLKRVGTGEVNRALRAIVEYRGARVKGKKVPKLFYGTQVSVAPPTFVIFVNDPAFFADDYRRYVEGALRKSLGFAEIPLKLHFRPREERQDGEKPSKGGRRGRPGHAGSGGAAEKPRRGSDRPAAGRQVPARRGNPPPSRGRSGPRRRRADGRGRGTER